MRKTFLWVTALVAILLSGILVFAPNLDQGSHHGIAQARTDIKTLEMAVELFQKGNGRLPATLNELVVSDHPTLARIPKNPWGAPYFYEINPRASGEHFRIWTIPSDQIQHELGQPEISN